MYIPQFSSVTQSCPTLCNPVDCSIPGFPIHHKLQELAQMHVHWVSDAIHPSHPLLSPSLPAFNLSQHQGRFQSQFFTSGGQSIGLSASASVLPMNIQYSQSFCNLGCRTYRYGGSMLCCLMNSDFFLLTVCCLSRIIGRVKILGKYWAPTTWQIWHF